ncbi:MAG: 2,3-bisphosphoglycerate-dependent phosphoglycerate mutase [Candidatus Levybacteria bacterium]|nr:2,3-bisphosphoglycerate-dependent phosphoglycerate mutase [Candidatus Levybacteria bacterium]
MANLILVRHGESEWNRLGVWTGLTDIGLSPKGVDEAALAGEKLKTFKIDCCYISSLKRARQTMDEIKKVLGQDFTVTENKALDERDYGIYTGQNKWEIKKVIGEAQFQKLRRGWNTGIPKGETLEDVYNRVVPYYKMQILPVLRNGKNVLVVAHGNSLRALVKYLDNITNESIENLEIATGEIYIYTIDDQGVIVSKEIK